MRLRLPGGILGVVTLRDPGSTTAAGTMSSTPSWRGPYQPLAGAP